MTNLVLVRLPLNIKCGGFCVVVVVEIVEGKEGRSNGCQREHPGRGDVEK